MAKPCIYASQGCDNEIPPGSKLPACPTCRASIHRWEKRRPAEVLDYRRRLSKYSARMDEVVHDDKVVAFRKKRRA